MNITDFLASEDVLLDVKSSGKARVLAELSRHASQRLDVAPDLIQGALTRREELGSTGVGDGLAIPHARMPEVRAPFGVLARLRSPIPFDAVDDRPVNLVCLLLLPAGTSGANLNALACVSRILRDPTLVEAVRRSETAAEIFLAIVSHSNVRQGPPSSVQQLAR